MSPKLHSYVAYVIISMLFTNISYAENILKGKVVVINSNGLELPKSRVKVDLTKEYGTRKEATTENNGDFDLSLENTNLKPRDKIKILVELDGWKIISPLDGVTYMPKDQDNERIIIKLVTNNSKIVLQDLSAKFFMDESYLNNKYFVQIIALSKEKDAVILSDVLSRTGFNAKYLNINKVKPPYDTLYKVFSGPYSSKKEAENARKTIIDITAIKEAIVVDRL